MDLIDETRDISSDERNHTTRTMAATIGLAIGLIGTAIAVFAVAFGYRFVKNTMAPFVSEQSPWLTLLVGSVIGVVVGVLLSEKLAKLGGWKG